MSRGEERGIGVLAPTRLHIAGRDVPADMIGRLAETDGGDLAGQLADRGYLLLRGLHDPARVLAARAEVLARLAEVDEVADGIATGRSRRSALHPDLGAFWRSVSETPALRAVLDGPRPAAVMAELFGEPPARFSFIWLRAMARGRASPLHIDHPYMNRGTTRLVTLWTPLGSVGLQDGPLYIVEGSHRWPELRHRFEGLDVDRDPSRPGHIPEHPIDFARQGGARLLTTSFAPGDALVFGMFVAHASFDNAAPAGGVRLSCDTRFQPAAAPMDERWSGNDPPAHGGKGYGGLAAAQPLTAELRKR